MSQDGVKSAQSQDQGRTPAREARIHVPIEGFTRRRDGSRGSLKGFQQENEAGGVHTAGRQKGSGDRPRSDF